MQNYLKKLLRWGGEKEEVSQANEGPMEEFVGRTGKTLTPLRTSGMIELDGTKYQAESEGKSIQSGKKIKVIGTKFHSWLIVELL